MPDTIQGSAAGAGGEAADAPRGAEAGAAGGPRVLLVEDNPDLAELMLMMLETLGYRGVHADGVAAALALASEAPPDLIVTDYRLGDGTGVDLLRAIRARSPRPVAAVLLTAYDRHSFRVPPEAGACHVLEKPAGLDELRAAIEAARGGREAGPDLPHPRPSLREGSG